MLLPTLSALVIHRTSKLARSHQAHIDQLLNDYEPVSVKAYRMLQDQARSSALKPMMIEEWCVNETNAIYEQAGVAKNDAYAFVKKELGD